MHVRADVCWGAGAVYRSLSLPQGHYLILNPTTLCRLSETLRGTEEWTEHITRSSYALLLAQNIAFLRQNGPTIKHDTVLSLRHFCDSMWTGVRGAARHPEKGRKNS